MKDWLDNFPYDPIPQLMASGDAALIYSVQRDLTGGRFQLNKSLLGMPEVARIIKEQTTDASWKYQGSGPQRQPYVYYNLVATKNRMARGKPDIVKEKERKVIGTGSGWRSAGCCCGLAVRGDIEEY